MDEVWMKFCKAQDLDQLSSLVEIDTLEKWFAFVPKNYNAPLPEVTNSPWETD